MVYSFRMARAILVAASVALIGLAGALAVLQLMLPDRIERRLQDAIERRESVRGGIESVRVCAPCGSYTLVKPDISVRAEDAWHPYFSAEEVEVSLLPWTILRAAPAGAVRIEAPRFHFRFGAGSSQTSWREIGELLLPVPLDRLSMRGGRVELSNPGLDPPVRWLLTEVELTGANIARRAAEPIAFEAEGRMGGEGEIRAHLLFPADQGFQLEATLSALPVQAFNDLLRNALGVDVTAGRLDADARVSGDEGGRLEGVIDGRIDGLDVLELGDIGEGNPLDLLWEVFVASTLAAAGASSAGAFEFQVVIRESVDAPGVDAWSLFGSVLQRSLVGLLESPARALEWLASRANPLGDD